MADKGLQGSMSQIAIGSGGLLGRGLGNGLQKQLYLPEPHNDFIFATWCEEMGLIGAGHSAVRVPHLPRVPRGALCTG